MSLRLVAVEVGILLPVARLALALAPFAVVHRVFAWYARMLRVGRPGHVASVTNAVSRAVEGMGRRMPGTTGCLARAIVAEAALQRRGILATLRFDVRSRSVGGPPAGAPPV